MVQMNKKELISKTIFSLTVGGILTILLFLLEYNIQMNVMTSIVIEIVKVGSWMFLWTGLHTYMYDYLPLQKEKRKQIHLNTKEEN